MSNLAATPPSIATTSLYPSVFDDEPPHAVLALIDDGHSLTPESRPVDPRAPIPEEDEETSSEAAIEPITPTETQHSQMFHTKMSGGTNGHPLGAIRAQPPLILNTAATPPPSAGSNDGTNPTPFAELQSPRTPVLKRPGVSSKDGSLKRTMSATMTALFGGRRSNSSSEKLSSTPFTQEASRTNRSDTMLGTGRLSTSRGSTANSPTFSRSNTPPSPSSPIDAERGECHYAGLEPCDDRFFNKQKNRSSTGHSFRDRFSNHKISFSTAAHQHKPDQSRHRATSVDLEQGQSNQSEAPELSRQPWGMVAETGIGLKSRRMSLNLPNDFTVEVVELYSEFGDQSKLLGRRGKNLGQGATANVRLMQRKGYAGELYAVKEFRGKSSNEDKEEYEKKIKSEYSIAKSLHHPNIVETIRLCTHKGKWNHVMEFCEQGDLFSLVNQKYLDQAGHKVDRLCLFKQLIQGLNYLHSHGIAHRDVKLENLLITKDSKLKITDFGVSEVFAGIHPGLKSAGGQCGKEMQDVRLCAPGICGSPPYIAPEVIAKKGEYDPRPLDVWGAAVVMLCMCAGGFMWNKAEARNSAIYDDLIKGWSKWNIKHDESDLGITETDYPHVKFFDSCINPPALRRVLLTMLNPNPTKRATMASVANNRWIKNIQCCQVDSYDDPTTVIDASKPKASQKITKIIQHNHLPPATHHGHKLVRLPGSTNM